MSGCAPRERLQPIFPPPADLEAVTEAKPIAPVAIVTSAKAAAEYDVAVESWGERLNAAGGRICRWALRNGAVLPFACTKAQPSTPPDPEPSTR
ncbi:hypothetical protein [Novosphingopyxis sp. YJ-S2-01]|uniref:hypothetical protein n=1 Tax=Novosphingopyxis sp. YJ-S2-01 TaxID=2794021 RepID=UPI0018DD3956|nr:hypothetical protein [Novosphingopyxis sp. YJ-S2-01]MBH9536930.1 hypothetical protein [Novosphingopyxis sp. YJ-S2-01]